MLPFKKILCPTDFSEASYKALSAADEIAKHFSAEILLVHVVEPLLTVPAGPAALNAAEYQIQLMASSKKGLEAVAKEYFSKGVKVRQTVLEGGPAYQIVQFAEKENVDLIIIATHGQTGWRHLLFGSVAEKVVRLATCAVLTIQAPHDDAQEEKSGKSTSMRRRSGKKWPSPGSLRTMKSDSTTSRCRPMGREKKKTARFSRLSFIPTWGERRWKNSPG